MSCQPRSSHSSRCVAAVDEVAERRSEGAASPRRRARPGSRVVAGLLTTGHASRRVPRPAACGPVQAPHPAYRYCPVPLVVRRLPGPSVTPGGSAPWRICSSCARAAICCANSAVWMPWNRPSSQPTSWACAIRSSASDGMESSVNGSASRSQLVAQLGCQAVLEFADRGLVDLLEPGAAGVVERSRAHLFEQLLDHGADAHDLRRLLDHPRQLGMRIVARLSVGPRSRRCSRRNDLHLVAIAHSTILAAQRGQSAVSSVSGCNLRRSEHVLRRPG